MFGIVQAQAPHRSDVLRRKRAEQQPDVSDTVRYIMLAKDVTSYYASLFRLSNVRDPPRQNGISVVGAAVFREETDQTLCMMSDLRLDQTAHFSFKTTGRVSYLQKRRASSGCNWS